jgi:hypothetical protein
MLLTTAQLATLKTWLTNNASGLDDEAAANALNLIAAGPSNIAWKTSVTLREVGDNFNGTELAGLSSLNHTRLLTVITLSTAGINPSLADRRQFFDDIFSGAGGATTRANLLALWKRTVTVGEKLFWTGTGTTASPAVLGPEGLMTSTNVSEARQP